MKISDPVIRVEHFTKRYGNFEAVRDISFEVGAGEIFGFCGPNGAGKSTTINTLCTILPDSEGEITICGHDLRTQPDSVRKDIGVVFQDMALDPKLTVLETLRLHCDFYGVPVNETEGRIDEVLELLDLGEKKNYPVGGLSGGMKRRVEIARGILHSPKILFLDEPTTGLDPGSRENVWAYIRKLQKKTGMTIFLTTHYMEEAEVCDRLAIMQSGRITALDTPAKLKQRYTRSILDLDCRDPKKVCAGLSRKSVKNVLRNGRLLVQVCDISEAIELLEDFRDELIDFEFHHGTLNDVFLEVTGDGSAHSSEYERKEKPCA